MSARKYNTLGNVLYVIDRRGKLYLERGRVKRSTTEFYYEIMTNTSGRWLSDDNKYPTRADGMAVIKRLAGV